MPPRSVILLIMDQSPSWASPRSMRHLPGARLPSRLALLSPAPAGSLLTSMPRRSQHTTCTAPTQERRLARMGRLLGIAIPDEYNVVVVGLEASLKKTGVEL